MQKMPTITIYKDGQKVREHIAAEGGLKAIAAVRLLIALLVDSKCHMLVFTTEHCAQYCVNMSRSETW